tara:strand:+ start:353 stop:751 length:399 start_codon:yes stop_codon:yes gene_type:complete
MAPSSTLPTSSKSTSELIQAFDLFHANRALWLQIEADKKRIRDADKAALLGFETGRKQPGFTLFRKLPSELRLEIWSLVATHSRNVVEIIALKVCIYGRWLPRIVWNTLIPAIHVCFEARKVGLECYTEVKR